MKGLMGGSCELRWINWKACGPGGAFLVGGLLVGAGF